MARTNIVFAPKQWFGFKAKFDFRLGIEPTSAVAVVEIECEQYA